MKSPRGIHLLLFRIAFFVCAIYFFFMGSLLIFAPGLVMRATDGQGLIVLGMLRGAGGSIIAYSILYILAALRPQERLSILYVLFFANLLAIILDPLSVQLGECELRHAMLDLPFEVISILGVLALLVGRRPARSRGMDHAASTS